MADNGNQFHSKLWKKHLEENNIQVLHTSVCYLQGNPTEGVNKEIGSLLRALCFTKHSRWAFVINDVEKCLNNMCMKVQVMRLHFCIWVCGTERD